MTATTRAVKPLSGRIPRPLLSYDREADAITIELLKAKSVARTVPVGQNVFADLDSKGQLLALEVLTASRYFSRRELALLNEDADFLTLPEAARRARLNADTLRRQIHNKKLRAVKRGRDWVVSTAALSNYMAEYSKRGASDRKVAV